MDKHLDPDALSDYAEGLLDGPRRAAAEAHLAGCAQCRRELVAAQAYFRELGGLEPVPAPADFLAKVRARLPQSASAWRRLWSGISSALRLVPMPIAVAVILGITAITVYLKQGGADRGPAVPMSAPANPETVPPISAAPEKARPMAAVPKASDYSGRAAPAPRRKASPAYEPGLVDGPPLRPKGTRIAGRRNSPAEIDDAPVPMAKSESAPAAAPGGVAANGSGAGHSGSAPSPAKPGLDGRKAEAASGVAAGAASGVAAEAASGVAPEAAAEGTGVLSKRSETRQPNAAKAKASVAARPAAAGDDAAASPFGYGLSLRTSGDTSAVLSGLRAMGVRCETDPAGRGERAYTLTVPAAMLRELAPYLSRYGTAVPQGARPVAGTDSVSVRLRLRLPSP